MDDNGNIIGGVLPMAVTYREKEGAAQQAATVNVDFDVPVVRLQAIAIGGNSIRVHCQGLLRKGGLLDGGTFPLSGMGVRAAVVQFRTRLPNGQIVASPTEAERDTFIATMSAAGVECKTV